MKIAYYFLPLLVSSMLTLHAQNNYVATSPLVGTPGAVNTIVGPFAGNTFMSGGQNTYLGFQAGAGTTTGQNNTFLGYQSGNGLTTGFNNSFLGYQTGSSNTLGINNTFLGYQAGYRNTTGGYNVFLGNQTGAFNTTGGSNLFMGSFAGGSNITGSYNLFIGNSSGQSTTAGDGNTFIGDGSGYGNTTGGNNTYIGRYAGFTGNGTGTNNTFIGYSSGVTSGSVTNSIALGAYAQVGKSNSIVLGGTGVNSVSVGIGNTSPNNRLEITAATTNASGLRFTNLNSNSATSQLVNTKVLTVDANGDVVLVGLPISIGLRSAASLWEDTESFIKMSSASKGVIIGNEVNKTPADYKLFVEGGIITEKIKVAVKNTDDWSDYVFAPTYKLEKLTKIEKFIKANKHLPGIPSAQEMVEQGNDLHKTDAKLLAKIEELTLYMIELKKDNQNLKQAVNSLTQQHIASKHKLGAISKRR